ncbi:hypothetical protein [Nocardia sp. IFM 10818]
MAASSPSWKNTPDFLACMQMDQAALTIVGPWAESPNFTVPGKGIVGSRVTLASSVDAVINGTRIYHDSRYASCGLSSLRSQQVPEGLSFESVEALSFPKLGDDTAAYRTIVSANINGKATTGIQDAVLIRVGRAQVAMEFDGDNATPFPIDEAHRLAQIVVARLPDSPGASHPR